MTANNLISICIPAYKNIEFLQRLLDSISMQLFRDFEVIVADDSPDGSVGRLCEEYAGRFTLHYFRNEQPLGTPENWNEAVRKASGQWIKIMHDDDWFPDAGSLGEFARAIAGNPGSSFIFTAYRDVFLDEGRTREMFVAASWYKAFLRNTTVLFSRNIVGPPSVILYKKDRGIYFDRTVKWVVDIEFYIRYLQGETPVYINKILVNVGLGKAQVTRDCFRLRPVESPENFYLLNKVGVRNLRNIRVYDAFWRLMRNLEIRHKEEIPASGYSGEIPAVILSMIRWQRLLPLRLWKIGILSKTGMFLNYIFQYPKIPA
jgi:glycosyltransferase involved in cell wall biosynthesis